MTDVFCKLNDVADCRMKFDFLHFHFPEIKQLIDQIQQSFCIAMNEVQLFFLIVISGIPDNFIEGRNDKAEWCTEFVAYIGKEPCF